MKRTPRTLLFCFALLVWSAVGAQAGQYEDAIAAAKSGDYAIALTLLRPLAEKGNAASQNALGGMYLNGLGLAQDSAAAAGWYRKAAEQGNADAQNNLGAIYENGEGVTQDYVRAHAWFNVAALSSQGERRKAAADNRDAIAAKMTSPQIEQAQALARTCLLSNYKECD